MEAAVLIPLSLLALSTGGMLYLAFGMRKRKVEGPLSLTLRPPKGISPALSRGVIGKPIDGGAVAAALVELSARKLITIDVTEESRAHIYTNRRSKKATQDLSAEGRTLLTTVKLKGGVIELSRNRPETAEDLLRLVIKQLSPEASLYQLDMVKCIGGIVLGGVAVLAAWGAVPLLVQGLASGKYSLLPVAPLAAILGAQLVAVPMLIAGRHAPTSEGSLRIRSLLGLAAQIFRGPENADELSRKEAFALWPYIVAMDKEELWEDVINEALHQGKTSIKEDAHTVTAGFSADGVRSLKAALSRAEKHAVLVPGTFSFYTDWERENLGVKSGQLHEMALVESPVEDPVEAAARQLGEIGLSETGPEEKDG